MKVTLDPGAILPTRAHELDAGYDLYSREDAIVYADDSWTFDTGVHMAIPEGYVGDVKSKSGMMMKYGIITDGTVDAGYTGSIQVKLFNLSSCAVSIVKGQKIAQLVIKKISTPELELVDRLEDTDRGVNGFGSTGDF
jgi:dUTP pyrophosphatase